MNNQASCFCTGPQNGEPFCPCEMRRRGIVQKDGWWVQPEQKIWPVEPVVPKTWPIVPFEQKNTLCPKCGLELHKVMMYCCPQHDCPCGLGPTIV